MCETLEFIRDLLVLASLYPFMSSLALALGNLCPVVPVRSQRGQIDIIVLLLTNQ